ncbi:EAL domain-containing protein [Deinococcus radiomollis]|uniref:EAL domain-containing protein n=1 Tax=Deinococcus radiomollis TaxID=468916 RepID=UPI00389257D4
MTALQNASHQLFVSTLGDLLKLHAPQATLLAPLGGQVFRISAHGPATTLPDNELSPPDEWMDGGELRWLSQGGALLGLLWSQDELPETTTALLNLLLRSAQHDAGGQDVALLLTHLPAPVAWLDGELRFRQVSRHFLNLHGFQHGEVLGRSVAEVFSARPQLPLLLGRALAGQSVCLPLEAVTPRGKDQTLWLRGEARPYFDAQGIGVLWTSQDASEERGLARQLDTLLDDSGVMMALLDTQGVVQNASSALMALGGGAPTGAGSAPTSGAAGASAGTTPTAGGTSLLGTPLWEWPSWPAESREKIRALVQQAAQSGAASADIQTVRGGLLHLSLHGDGLSASEPASGEPGAHRAGGVLIAECHDLSALRELQEQTALQRSLIDEILARSGEATLIVNPAGKVSLANEEAARMLGIDAGRLNGAGLGRLLKDMGVQVYDAALNRLDYQRWLRETMPPDQEVLLVNATGLQRTVRLGVSLLPSLEGQRPGVMLTLRDVSALRRMEARLRHDTHHDTLTGLLNRAGLRSRLLGLGAEQSVMLLALDISGFPALTAALGRIPSDALLVHLAARLIDWRPELLAARLSSNVFMLAVQIPGAPPGKAMLEDALQDLQRHLRAPLRLAGRELPLSFHLGAAGGLVGQDAEALLGQAETALGYVKHERQGGTAVGVVYQEAMRAEVARDFRLESELPAAIGRGELRLGYQPVLSLKDPPGHDGLKVVGAEALLRWNHPELGLLAPSAFLPLAARSAVISDIGEWVVREALSARAGWQARHPDMRVSVNLSLDELLRQDDLERLFPLMEQYGPPDFELSAVSLTEYSERTLGLLERLSEMGAQIVVDDFGDGASSLNSLERFPISGIKLHPSFVAQLHHPRAYKLLAATTAMAASLGVSVTAVGVENSEQLTLLKKAGVGAVQGYYFAGPMTPEELVAFRTQG